MEQQNGYKTISKFDKAVGGLLDGNSLRTKPTTMEEVEKTTGEAETFIIQTVRTEEGDSIIIKFVDVDGVKRIILPPKVSNCIARQKDSLTARARTNSSRARAKAMKESGQLPGFMKDPNWKQKARAALKKARLARRKAAAA